MKAIAELDRRVVQADGGRLKLEWATLRRRSGDRVDDLMWWEGYRLLGFLGVYGFDSLPELAGMVAPDARRRGIGAALLDAALPLCRERSDRRPLLIVPRPSVAGKLLALRRGGVLDHSEHALVLSGDPPAGSREPAITLRAATVGDLPLVSRLLELGFSEPAPAGLAERLDSPGERTAIVELAGVCFGFRSGISVRRRRAPLLLGPPTPMSFRVAIGLQTLAEQTSAEEEPDLKLNDELTTMVSRSNATSSKPC